MSEARDNAAAENRGKLIAKLRELFQLDRGELDFGLYRVMAVKRAAVEEFLRDELLPQVEAALGEIAAADVEQLRAELEKVSKSVQSGGVDPAESPVVQELQAKIAAAKTDARAEAETYDHLHTFFARYYSEGDFMSLRRYKSAGKEAYALPYNGEEVKLHWANADQFYIKTAENYASYIFTLQGGSRPHRVRFEIAAADAEKDNIKPGSARMFLLAEDFLGEDGGDLIVRFAHRALTPGEKTKYPGNNSSRQKNINADTEARILQRTGGGWKAALAAKPPGETDAARTVLGKHIAAYTAKNSFDYFIHKDLGGFLRRELDSHLKSEVLSLENLELAGGAAFARALAQAKAVKLVGEKIIDFLAQLEDFQKRLWLKKKFVLETNYCITLGRVPQNLYAKIAANEAQCAEWKELFAPDELTGKTANADFVRANPNLVLDTRHFDTPFTDKLLAALSDKESLDEQLDGLLVHGENFQALNLLQAQFAGRVKCVYIDPPYNSPSSRIIYKNDYLHSSWVSLMESRVDQSRALLKDDGVFVCAIDENEGHNLAFLLAQIFHDKKCVCISVIHNPRGIQGDDFSFVHESAYFVFPHGTKLGMRKLTNDKPKPLMKTGGESLRETAKNCFYPILVSGDAVVGFGDVPDESFSPSSAVVKRNDGVVEVWPISPTHNLERKWRYARQTVESVQDRLFVKKGRNDLPTIYLSKFLEAYRTVWDEAEFNAAEYGSVLLKSLGFTGTFTYPKSVWTVYHSLCVSNVGKHDTVLDYFAGSGTTAHAVINLNRADRGKRKYILVELGHHFDTVLLPRIKKVVHAKEWKDGKPRDRDGVPHFIKYIRLESYEDTLDSLLFEARDDIVAAAGKREMIEDYQLRYALAEETKSSPALLGKDFIDPFAYTISVVRDGIRRDCAVDLAETFNYLLGMRVETRRVLDGILAITGTDSAGNPTLAIWRNMHKIDAAALDAWFTKHRATFGGALQRVYVNGENNLAALRGGGDRWAVEVTELVFRELMFAGE